RMPPRRCCFSSPTPPVSSPASTFAWTAAPSPPGARDRRSIRRLGRPGIDVARPGMRVSELDKATSGGFMTGLDTVRTDVVGSLLRPAALKQARERFDEGQ